MEKRHIPGLSASIVIEDILIWRGAYGYADIENEILVTNKTLFKIASVSKTLTATCLMQLYESGYFDLHDSINDFLPFDVINPYYLSEDITFHMLLTHSSSIIDNWDYLFHFEGDAPISFQSFLENYLVPGGEYYNPDSNFGSWAPGTKWSYSNIAVALIGYLIETISQNIFTDYTRSYLFEPLHMNESGWYLRDLNIDNISIPYHWTGSEYESYGHIGYVDVPAGDLRTSSTQLINFLTMFINNGSFNGETLLDSDLVEMMLTQQLSFNDNMGLIWWKSSIGGRTVWGHGGSDYGCRATMQFDPISKIGVIVLINGEAGLTQIADTLFEYAESFFDNLPPDKPTDIEGPSNGKINSEYTYNVRTTDPDGDVLYYIFDWGDETDSDWLGPYDSNEKCMTSHKWSEKGEYAIKVKAKDIHGLESEWSDPFVVSMPHSKLTIKTIFQRFFEQHVILDRFLQIIG